MAKKAVRRKRASRRAKWSYAMFKGYWLTVTPTVLAFYPERSKGHGTGECITYRKEVWC